ncbi:MAG: putative addiction module antidote protein [Gammaproteobacteria bacterium]|nr:putative addiction module antidote protein [Gammaproteobacteria bacterium]
MALKCKTLLYEDALIQDLKNKREAENYLEASLEAFQDDNNMEAFLLALRHIAKAEGSMGALAEKVHMNRQALYKTLSANGNPRLQTLGAIVNALGFRLNVSRA